VKLRHINLSGLFLRHSVLCGLTEPSAVT